MVDKKTESTQKNGKRSTTPPSPAAASVREVTVTHLDSPPPLGKNRIHPRRPAPIVPTREQRTSKAHPDDDKED